MSAKRTELDSNSISALSARTSCQGMRREVAWPVDTLPEASVDPISAAELRPALLLHHWTGGEGRRHVSELVQSSLKILDDLRRDHFRGRQVVGVLE